MRDFHYNDFHEVAALWAAQPPVTHAPTLSRRSLAILKSICHVTSGGGRAGCACCPPELLRSCWQEPTPGLEPRFVPDLELSGSFSQPGVQEVVLTSPDCGRNLGTYGALVLARHTPGGWKLIDMDAGRAIEQAIPWRLDSGLHVLVALLKGGKTPHYSLEVLRFDQPDADRALVAWGNGADNCILYGPGFSAGRAELVGSQTTDRNGDGKPDLVVRLKAHAGKFTAAMMAGCTAYYDGQAPNPAFLLPPKTFELVFTFDGASFTADAKKLAAFTAFVEPAGP